MQKGLTENGFIVDLCFDGQEGLYMAQNYPYDAILLDLMLPDMDGITILQALRAAIRRNKGRPSPLLAVADLAIDTNAKTVSRAGRAITLSAREYALLEYLALNSGRVVSRTEMIEHIYATQYDWDSNVIDVYINYLRNKIDKGFSPSLLHTVRGAGYVLKAE